MANEIKVTDQVVHRKWMPQQRVSLMKLGTVTNINAQTQEAVVIFKADNTRATLPLSSLERVADRFNGHVRIDTIRPMGR